MSRQEMSVRMRIETESPFFRPFNPGHLIILIAVSLVPCHLWLVKTHTEYIPFCVTKDTIIFTSESFLSVVKLHVACIL